MRIAYTALHLEKRYIEGGVGHKIFNQMALWKELGAEVQLFLHTPDALKLPNVHTFQFKQAGIPNPFCSLFKEVSRSIAVARMIKAVKSYKPDIIYLRYGLFTYPLQRLFKIAPVVMELNTNDVVEYALKSRFHNQLNQITRRWTLGLSRGFVYVSQEISNLEHNKIFYKPFRVIPNGILLDHFIPIPAPQNLRPRLVFVGSPGMVWHGIDKLAYLSSLYPDLQIDIIGYAKEDSGFPNSSKITGHGFLSQESVREVLIKADAACGTLALHRKEMEEASPLKVREALAYGIPVILGYQDTALKDLNCDFILNIPNTEANVKENAQKMYSFIKDMMGKRVDYQLVRPRIDMRDLETERIRFFEEVLSSKDQP